MQTTFRSKTVFSSLLLQLAVAVPVLTAGPAFAHIDVDMGGTHMSRVSGGYDIKESPCGVADAPRGANVYKYRPGSTINIKVVENIPHPGYFRIAFDNEGDDNFPIPTGTSGENGNCGNDPNCGPGKEDFCSNETVLLDNLDAHAGGASKTYTWSVTLPNVECTNCTLQIIQMMNDLNIHFQPYPADDIYYHCIDIELSNDAPESTDMPVENNGMVCKSGETAGAAGAPGAAGAGGSSGAAGAAGASTAGAGGTGGAGTGGASAADGGSEDEPAAAAGSAAPAAGGSAGAKAASGGAAAPSTSSGAAGAKAPATGSTSSPQGAAGKPAATSTSSGSAGTAAPAASEPAPESTEESGGCQAAGGSASGLFAPALLGLFTFALRGYRRRRAS